MSDFGVFDRPVAGGCDSSGSMSASDLAFVNGQNSVPLPAMPGLCLFSLPTVSTGIKSEHAVQSAVRTL